MEANLRAALPHPPPEKVVIPGDTVPSFDKPVGNDGNKATIAPPIVRGRGAYVSNVCAPMAAMKSRWSRKHHWDGGGITVVVGPRISYNLNALQEWRASDPTAPDDHGVDNDKSISFNLKRWKEACKHERFDGANPARVWCYLTHTKEQLEALFRAGNGVCIISFKSAPSFLRALREMGPFVMLQNLYIEETMAHAQMWNSKVLRKLHVMEAMRELATSRSRRVFSFDADYLLDEEVWDLPLGGGRSATLMGYLVPDLPHKAFVISESRSHMRRNVVLLHENDKGELDIYEAITKRLTAMVLRHGSNFRVWYHQNYEKRCMASTASDIKHGIESVHIVGGVSDDVAKLQRMVDFDNSCTHASMVRSTSAVTVGVNSELDYGACVLELGTLASGPIEAAQSGGRPGRRNGLEWDTIPCFLVCTSPPKPNEKLTPFSVANVELQDKLKHKAGYAQRSQFSFQTLPPALERIAVLNLKQKLDTRYHLSLYTSRVIKYKVGWTQITPAEIAFPPRMASRAVLECYQKNFI